MDKESKELFNAIIGELDRMQDKINDKFEMINGKIDKLQNDINILKARNDFTDLYALYGQLEKRIAELEKKGCCSKDYSSMEQQPLNYNLFLHMLMGKKMIHTIFIIAITF